MDRVLIADRWLQYVPRTMWREEYGEFKKIRLEDELIKALENRRFALLMGIPGIGKSTTAEYITKKFCDKGWVVVKIVPREGIDGGLGLRFERRYDKALVIELETLMMDEKRLMRLAKVIEGFSKDPKGFGNERIKKVILNLVELFKEFKEIVRKIKGIKGLKLRDIRSWKDLKIVLGDVLRFKEKAEKKEIEIEREVVEVVENFLRSVESFERGFRENMESFAKEVGGVGKIGFDADIVADIYKVFESFDLFKGITESVLRNIPIVSGVVSLFLAYKGLMELDERFDIVHGLKKRFEDLNTLIVVDDMADCDKDIFGEFLKICHSSGLKVFVVRRIRLEDDFKELRDLLNTKRMGRIHKALRLAKVEGIDCKDCVFFMLNTTLEEFEGIVRANLDFVNSMRAERGLKALDINEIKEWYEKTGGIPYLALTLMCYMDAKDLKVKTGEGGEYKPMITVDFETAKENLERIIDAYEALFRLIVEEEFYKAPIILQPTAEDELEEFYRYFKCEDCLRRLRRREYLFRKFEEEWDGKTITVYDLNDVNMKLRKIADVLAENVDWIRDEFTEYRRKLLEIMTEKTMRAGKTNYRMILFALDHLEKLESAMDEEIERWYLIWLIYALQGLPTLGLIKAKRGIEIARKRGDVYSWAFLWQLTERCKAYELEKVRWIMAEVKKALNEMKAKDEASKALELTTRSAFLLTIFKHLETIDLRIYEEILKSYKEISDSAKGLGILREYVMGKILINRVEIMIKEGELNKAKVDLEWILKNCSNLKFDEFAEDFFKPLGGKAEEKFKECIDELLSSAHYYLGLVLMDLMDFEGARREFEKALKVDERLGVFMNAIVCRSLIKRVDILNGKDADFRDLFEDLKTNAHELTEETISCRCGEYIVSMAKRSEDLDLDFCFEQMTDELKALTEGVLAVLGKFDKRRAIEDIRNYDKKVCMGYRILSLVEILQRFDDRLFKAEITGKGEEFVKDVSRFFGDVKKLRYILDMWNKDEQKAIDELRGIMRDKIDEIINEIDPLGGIHVLSRILRFYLEGYREKARKLALFGKEYFKDRSRCLSWLLGEIADALEKGDDEKFKDAVVKLYYYHI